jgi:hypothetical protein
MLKLKTVKLRTFSLLEDLIVLSVLSFVLELDMTQYPPRLSTFNFHTYSYFWSHWKDNEIFKTIIHYASTKRITYFIENKF